MKHIACALAAAFCAAAAWGAQALVPQGSEIRFTSVQMGVPVEGRFRSFEAQLEFDPRHPEAARVSMSIDLASASLGTTEAEVELAKPAWFATKQFPKAVFRSQTVKALGGNRFEMAGTLAIKGVTRDMVVPVALTPAPDGSRTLATGSFVLRRLDFRIGDGEWNDTALVANDVQVAFKLTLSGLAAP